jgi:hypothetical protein
MVPYKELILLAVSGAGFLFVSNKMKALYIVASVLNLPLWGRGHITVVDDIERSSLNSAETWAIFSNLWSEGHRYLILLGYDSDRDKSEIIERAIKLGGHLVFLPTDYNVNYKIAKDLDPGLPFAISEWFGRFDLSPVSGPLLS